MKFYLHICNQYQPSLSKSILIWLGVISPKKAANLTILFSPLSASAFGVHCQQNVWHWKNWIPTTNYLRMTVASISEKPVSSGLWKAVWQAVKPPDDQVRVQQYFCHKAKFSTPKWSVRFPCKSRSTTPVIKFLCKSLLLKWHWSLCRSIQILRRVFLLWYKSFGNLRSIIQACLENCNRYLNTAKQKGSF